MSEKPSILVQRRGEFLVPESPMDGERIRDLPAGKALKIEVRQPRRSNPQLRLYWAVLGLVCENLDQPIKPEDLHQWLKMRLHLTTEIRLRSGQIVEVPKSIAFDKMEPAEFHTYFENVLHLLVEHVIPGIGKQSLRREAQLMLGHAA